MNLLFLKLFKQKLNYFVSNKAKPSRKFATTLVFLVAKKEKLSGKLCGNFRQYYVEESDNNYYAEKMPDYGEISKVKKVVPLSFSNILNTR